MSTENKKNVFVVLGVARSGTSAISGGLQALGINFGDKLLPGDSRNPKGFFEDTEILYNTNRGLLYFLNYSPLMDLNTLDQQTAENDQVVNDYKKYAMNVLQTRLASAQTYAFKAPCTLTLMGFWESVFKNMDIEDKYVIVVRNPLASAHSFHKWVRYDVEVGVMLWLRHMIHAVNSTQNKKRVVVCYELMLQDARKELARVHKALDVPTVFDQQAVDAYANEFLDKKLRHHTFGENDLKSHAAMVVAPLSLQLYEVLMKLAKDEMQFSSPEFQSAWSHIQTEFAKLAPLYNYIDSLLRRNKQYERTFRSLHRSIPWKLIAPLRFLDESIRKLRKRAKAKGRLEKIYE